MKVTSHRCLIAVLAVLAVGAVPASAQVGSTTAAVQGRIVDDAGEAVVGAQVTARNEATGVQRGGLTNEEGRYFIPLLQPGTYTIAAQSIGYEPVERTGQQLSVGEAHGVDLVLSTEAVELAELRVEAAAADIDARQGGVIESVAEAQLEELPVAGRDFTDFINLSALVTPQPQVGTGGQFSIGGARTSGTNVQIDGADANNSFFGENRGSSRIPFTFSLESIKEFQIVTNGYDVEFGRFSGGLVNAVTRSGTNEFSGSAFTYYRGEQFTANGFDNTPPANFSSWQFGARASGPIVRDQAHFLISVDAQQRNQPVFALNSTRLNVSPDSVDRFIDILENVYGLTDASENRGVFQETDDEWNVFARVDWALSPDHRLTIRNNFADFVNENDRISPSGSDARTVGGPYEDRSNSLVAELNSTFSSDVWNVFRVQWSTEHRPRDGNSYLPAVEVGVEDDQGNAADLVYGGSFFGILFRNRLDENKIQFADNLSIRRGDHTFKIGTDNIWSRTENLFWLNGNGFMTFSSLEDFENRNPGFFLRFVPPPDANGDISSPYAEFDLFESSVYAQDEWQVTDRFLLTMGLRYDNTRFLDPATLESAAEQEHEQALQAAFGDALSATAVPEDNDNIAPRVSATYDVNADGRQIVRGGVGLFYGRVPGVLHGNVLSKVPPLQTVGCFGPGIDTDLAAIDERGTNIQAECISGIGFVDEAGQTTLWDPEFQMPRTLKANLGYEGVLGERTRAGIDLVASATAHNFSTQELNLNAEQFSNAEGRSVHVARDDYDPTDEPSGDRQSNGDFDRVFFQTSQAEARRLNLNLNLQHAFTETVQLGVRYGLNVAYDNSSYSCCTEGEGWGGSNPTAGNPNFIGDPGDDLEGNWGPADFESRHVFVSDVGMELPMGFRVSGILRSQSGRPFTPMTNGDVNGDGDDGNDRAYIPDPEAVAAGSGNVLLANGAEGLTRLENLLESESCLAEQAGGIATRNSCRNPWFHRLDLRVTKEVQTVGGQRAEVIIDLFNTLDGLGNLFCDEKAAELDGRLNEGACGLGRWTFKRNRLLTATDYDEASDRVVYSVNNGFGSEVPLGFEPFQFQAQIGVRYTF